MANCGVLMAMLVILAGVLGKVSVSYNRPSPRATLSIRRLSDDTSAPEQVHVSTVGQDRMRVSWVTEELTPSEVHYGKTSGSYDCYAQGNATRYKYLWYTSGFIHHVVTAPLLPNTVYFYRCGGHSSREFSFKTPPTNLPIKFVIVGDLGQTEWTQSTLNHISNTNYDMLLLPGDLAYADFLQHRWDSFGRLVEPLASQRPWMVNQGNHEVEKLPLIHKHPFTSYNARWKMPYEESGSSSNLYYSFDVANGVHVIMLGSYTDFGTGSDQYNWVVSDLKRIDRKKTPWVVVIVHAPWYNSNTAHQGEHESTDMRNDMERLIYDARVDFVFSGHVHAYERFNRVYDGKVDKCGPVYITIGDGGNREGLARGFKDPPGEISIYREASFGYGTLEVMNSTRAQWRWHRNEDQEAVSADSICFTSLVSDVHCTPS